MYIAQVTKLRFGNVLQAARVLGAPCPPTRHPGSKDDGFWHRPDVRRSAATPLLSGRTRPWGHVNTAALDLGRAKKTCFGESF